MEHEPNPAQSRRMIKLHSHDPEAGRQCQGPLWSALEDIFALLQIPDISSAAGKVLFQRVRMRTGQRVHRAGQAFDTLYVVDSGYLKTTLVDESGNEQVLSFPMRGDMVGIDGVHLRRHPCETVALSECDLILLPFARLTSLSRVHSDIENLMYRMLSRELALREAVITMLGTPSADARVAHFLMSLSDRLAAMGYSSKAFNLRMTRQEIGNYLSLTLESVSRSLSAFAESGWITVHHRSISIDNAQALRRLSRPHVPARPARTRQPLE